MCETAQVASDVAQAVSLRISRRKPKSAQANSLRYKANAFANRANELQRSLL
jgi:hypothetical protein